MYLPLTYTYLGLDFNFPDLLPHYDVLEMTRVYAILSDISRSGRKFLTKLRCANGHRRQITMNRRVSSIAHRQARLH